MRLSRLKCSNDSRGAPAFTITLCAFLKDWIASRLCWVDRCSFQKEYIIPVSRPFESYHRQQNNLPKAKNDFLHLTLVHSQVLQTTIRRLHDTWFVLLSVEKGLGASRNTVNSNPLCFLNSKTTPSRVSMSCCRRLAPRPSTCIAPFLMVL